MKTLKQISVFFATFFGTFLMLSGAIAVVTWEPIYDVIHSAWSFPVSFATLFSAIMVTIDYCENE